MKDYYKYIFIVSCFWLGSFQSLFSNNSTIDSLGFISPVNHQIKLTGNFMEIRTNHFHSGIDIKSSKGVPGDDIKSVQDGYVSRIKVQSGSYGQSLYIDHPNGYTSVYAHLDSYIPEIENYLKDIQYGLESFAVDIYLPDSILMIKKGQLIAQMGNKGRSYGPHLHFELRKTDTEIPVNPELLGLGPTDHITPTLESLSIYNIVENNQVESTTTKYFKKENNIYSLHNDIVSIDGDFVAFGIQGYDQMNGTANKNGIYSLRVEVDGDEFFNWTASDFSFEESKKINGFIDFKKRITLGQKVYKLYEPYCASMSNVRSYNNGIINLGTNKIKAVSIVATDIYGNSARLNFKIQGKSKSNNSLSNVFKCDTSIIYKAGMFDITFPPKSLFSPLKSRPVSSTEIISNQKCHKVSIGTTTEAVSKYFKIETPIPTSYDKSWTLVTYDSKRRFVTFGCDTLDGRMYSRVDQLGEFFLIKDKIPPSYTVINLEAEMKSPWKIIIKDNFIPDGKSPDLYYSATVNGNWICMDYDLKNNMLVFNDFDRLPSGIKEFELIIADHQGNSTKLKRSL